ncbi:hypothetical protein, partial [Pectobacterium carotovorum]|uniref:hypothetical protein n=1 Tax=Pectobacterium carotovorum TaxID=554 RepID=UPI001F0E65E3
KYYAIRHRLTTLRSERCFLSPLHDIAIEGCRTFLLPLIRPVMQTELYSVLISNRLISKVL